ncbi:hypothetical protein ACFLQ0_04120 [Nitrospinota bacterium]
MMDSPVFGCNAFGLNDCVIGKEDSIFQSDFFLADALLPPTPFGEISTAEKAEEERTNTGLDWPPEAQVLPGKPLRRVPIPLSWKYLVDAGDRNVRWNVGGGVSFPVGNIIAEHICTKLDQAGFSEEVDGSAVVAIPDQLDEFGQEAILKALYKKTKSKVDLLWRPIAAAMEWLNNVQDALPKPGADDFLFVVYLGADSIEFTTFRLREQVVEGKRYILPIRERPGIPLGANGLDWAAATIEDIFGVTSSDAGAFWQAFTNFPEVWSALAQSQWDSQALPKPWSKKKGWTLWAPSSSLLQDVWLMPVRQSETFHRIVKASCDRLKEPSGVLSQTWEEFLAEETHRALDLAPPGKMLGMILCGPLTPNNLSPWILSIDSQLRDRGLEINPPFEVPRPNALWLTSHCDDPIACGARVFGYRIKRGEPTYLDTLSQLSLLAIRNGEELEWINLIDSSECEGGVTYDKTIYGKFILKKDEAQLVVYLKKEEEHILEKEEKPPFRKAIIKFHTSPESDTDLDVNVIMRPASGLAQIEVLPKDNAFLKGRRVFLDYSTMSDEYELPQLEMGWPEIVKRPVTKNPNAFTDDFRFIEFFSTHLDDEDYLACLDSLRSVLTSSVEKLQDGKKIYEKRIDTDGKAGIEVGQRVIDDVAKKIGKEFIIAGRDVKKIRHVRKMITVTSWLWLTTPKPIIQHLEKFISDKRSKDYPQHWSWYVEAASRCFKTPEMYQKLFNKIYRRLKIPPSRKKAFPIQSARAIRNVLLYRSDGQDGLTKEMAYAFVESAVDLVEEEVNKKNVAQSFFQNLLLFLMLLRFRKKDHNFLNPTSSQDKEIFDRLFVSFDSAEKLFYRYKGYRARRARQILEDIKAYMHFKGVPGLVHVIMEFAGEEGS